MTAQSSFQTTSWLTSDGVDSAPPNVDAIAPLEGSATDSATGQSANGGNNNNRVAVAVACVQCRSRHLKCDGAARCARCVAEGIQCSYVKSRRGWKGPRKSAQRLISAPPSGPGIGPPVQQETTINFASPPTPYQPTPSRSPEDGGYTVDFLGPPDEPVGPLISRPAVTQLPLLDNTRDGLIAGYFIYFHPCHPFLLPYEHTLQLLQRSPLQHLELAIQYMASFYIPTAPTAEHRDTLRRHVLQDNSTKDGTFVQALFLLAIGLHIENDDEDSASVLTSAVALALELGLNRRDFAHINGENNSLLEESWRRTWWELFVIDGMMGGVNQKYNLQLMMVDMNVTLPCEEIDYAPGRIPFVQRSLEDYDDAVFIEDETVSFSSGTYRIDAIRILHKVFASMRADPSDSGPYERADTHLTNWSLHLPADKRKPVGRDGKVDEVLFCAHMIMNACCIMLHRPRSDLNYEDVKDVTTCIKGGPGQGSSYKDLHTAKAMHAAKEVSKLARLPCPLVKHTPFFNCALTMAAVVYLSYWSFIATEGGDTVIKEHIRLNIGVLKALSEIYPIASTVLGQVKGVAQELFASRKALNNEYWAHVTKEEILQGMIEDSSSSSSDLYGEFSMVSFPSDISQ